MHTNLTFLLILHGDKLTETGFGLAMRAWPATGTTAWPTYNDLENVGTVHVPQGCCRSEGCPSTCGALRAAR